MTQPIEFRQREKLSARKMNDLSSRVAAGAIAGRMIRSKSGVVKSNPDERNYIDSLRAFDVERISSETLIVRGGAYEYYSASVRYVTGLIVSQGGESLDPVDYAEISPTLAAETEYSVYLELAFYSGTLEAKVVKTVDYPSFDSSYDRRLLTTFETDDAANIGGLDPLQIYSITSPESAVVAPSKPFDLIRANTNDDGEFSLEGDGAEYILWMAGRRIGKVAPEPYLHTDDFTWNASANRWDLDTALEGDGTLYVWIELNRAPESAEVVAEMFTSDTDIPAGTAEKYQLRAEIFPLWRLTHEDDKITATKDLRDSRHLSAMA